MKGKYKKRTVAIETRTAEQQELDAFREVFAEALSAATIPLRDAAQISGLIFVQTKVLPGSYEMDRMVAEVRQQEEQGLDRLHRSKGNTKGHKLKIY